MRRGFTLIELLIVIGILAILSTAVVLVLNPAEILKAARDGQRISDLKNVASAINFYLARDSAPTLNQGFCDINNTGNTHPWRSSDNRSSTNDLQATRQPFCFPGGCTGTPLPSAVIQPTDVRKVDGNGWVPVPLVNLPGNPPLSKLPVDPNPNILNNYNAGTPGRYYAYQCNGLTYEINANMESAKFDAGGDPTDVESTDGGTIACFGIDPLTRCSSTNALLIYEIGNDSGLDL